MTYGEIWIGNADTANTPVLWINKYLQEKITGIFVSNTGETNAQLPFFPSTPSTIDDLTEYFALSTQGLAATWDRLIKMNKKGFPHIKCEQVLYYFYATGQDPILKMITIQESVLRLMDRFDETAEEINNWCSNRQVRLDDGTVVDCPFYFHNFKVYQLEETRDIIDFGTARTYGGNKIIIDYDYHQMTELTNADWQPEPKLSTKIVL
jgi:hypothetical protein